MTKNLPKATTLTATHNSAIRCDLAHLSERAGATCVIIKALIWRRMYLSRPLAQLLLITEPKTNALASVGGEYQVQSLQAVCTGVIMLGCHQGGVVSCNALVEFLGLQNIIYYIEMLVSKCRDCGLISEVFSSS